MFYEDVHQDYFWDLAFGKFGHEILHHRSVKQGSRVYYAEYRKNWIKCKTIGSLSRIGGHDPFPSKTGYMMDELEEAANITNAELQALKFGRLS